MLVGTFLRRWIDVLAGVYFAGREALRARQSLIVACENGHFIVRRAQPNRVSILQSEQRDEPEGDTVVAVLSAGTPASAEVMRAARSGFVILELPAVMVVVRRITVPAQARAFLPGIVRNQIERLSPWHADQAVYGFDAEVNAEEAATLDVRVLIAPRADIDGARAELAAIGLPVDRIVTRQRDADIAKSITLWSRLVDVSREDLDHARWRIGVGIAAVVVTSLVIVSWAMTSAASIRQESDEVDARAKTLQRQIQGPRTPQWLASLKPDERAWYAKETASTAVIVIEALSRALPDGAYLTEMRLENGTLRMIGLTNDAPSLIAPLEHSGHLADVRFFAPTTRGTDGAPFRFNIEARVESHFKIAQDQP